MSKSCFAGIISEKGGAGSGARSGSASLTNGTGSGSWRPKNMRNLRIQIPNTGSKEHVHPLQPRGFFPYRTWLYSVHSLPFTEKEGAQSRESPLHSTSISGLWNFFLRGPDSRGQIHRPGLGGDSGIGLSYWPASLCSPVPGRYDNSILESIISPSQGLRIWLEIGINDGVTSDQRRAFIFDN